MLEIPFIRFVLNQNMKYTFQYVQNNYITNDSTLSVTKRSGVMYAEGGICVTAAIPAWTNVTFGKLTGWNHGQRTLFIASTLHSGDNAGALQIMADADGNVIAVAQGASTAQWFYGMGVTVL